MIPFTAGGFIGGLILGAMLDHFGFPWSAIGLWLARTFAGEGESVFEGTDAVGQLFRPPVLWQRPNRARSMTRHDPTLD